MKLFKKKNLTLQINYEKEEDIFNVIFIFLKIGKFMMFLLLFEMDGEFMIQLEL